jgi:pre-mRNA-splicing factor SYF2
MLMAFSNLKHRADWILENEARRKEAAERGEDYNRLKMLEIGANEAERLERKNNKKNPDTGFADFEQVNLIL